MFIQRPIHYKRWFGGRWWRRTITAVGLSGADNIRQQLCGLRCEPPCMFQRGYQYGHQYRPQYRHQRGVTLIEMLIVLAIVAVLLTMVVPAYNRYVMEARRADAHDMLQKNARLLQNCLTLAGAFDAGCDLVIVSSEGHYVLDQTVTQNTWQLSAVPAPAGPQTSDSDCTRITLDHIGRKTATGSNTERCW